MSLQVSDNRRKFEIAGIEPWTSAIKIRTRNKAVRGGANKEIIREFGVIFSKGVSIASGEKSRQKKIFIPGVSCEYALKKLGTGVKL